MAGERRFVISIVGDDRSASSTMRKVGKEADNLDRSARRTTGSTGSLISVLGGALPGAAGQATGAMGDLADGFAQGAGGITLIAGASVVGIKQFFDWQHAAVTAASNVAEQIEATRQTFGRSADTILSWSETTAESIGVSRSAALQASNAFGGMFTNLGFAEQKSAELSIAAVQLAGDLASFKNLGTDEALAKIRSGLAGEVEPLRAVGVFLGENVVKARAMTDGLADSKGELSETAKVATRFQLILEQTTKAQGDAARTAESYANGQRRVAAETEDLKATAGASLLPMWADVTLGTEQALTAVDGLTGGSGKGLAALATFLSGPVIGGLQVWGKTTKESIDPTQRLAEAQQVYARVIVDGKENTEKGRVAREAYTAAVKAAETATGRLASGLETEAEKQAKATKEAKEHAQALDAAVDSVFSLSTAERAMEDATDAVADADKAAADAQKDLDDLRAKGAVDAKEVAQATKSLESASRSLTDAREAEADAEKALAEARKGASAFDLEGGELDLESAKLASFRAGNALRDAEAALAQGRADGLQGPELNDLELAVAEARIANLQAIRNVTQAEEALQQLRDQGTSKDSRVADAEDQVKDARWRVKEATDARNEAEAALRLAQAGDPEFDDKLAKAADAVKDAQDRASGARWRAVEASNGLKAAIDKEAAALAATGGAADYVRARIDELIRQHPQLAAVLGTVRALIYSPGTTAASEQNRIAESDTAHPGTAAKTTAARPAAVQTVSIDMSGMTVHGATDAEAFAREVAPRVMDELKKEARRSGPLGFEDPFSR